MQTWRLKGTADVHRHYGALCSRRKTDVPSPLSAYHDFDVKDHVFPNPNLVVSLTTMKMQSLMLHRAALVPVVHHLMPPVVRQFNHVLPRNKG